LLREPHNVGTRDEFMTQHFWPSSTETTRSVYVAVEVGKLVRPVHGHYMAGNIG